MEAEAGAGAGAGAGARLERPLVLAASDGDRQVWAAKGALYLLVYVSLGCFEWHVRYSRIRSGDGRGGQDRQFGRRKREDELGCTLVGQHRRLQRYFYRIGSLEASHGSSQKQWRDVGGFKVREPSAGSGGRVVI